MARQRTGRSRGGSAARMADRHRFSAVSRRRSVASAAAAAAAAAAACHVKQVARAHGHPSRTPRAADRGRLDDAARAAAPRRARDRGRRARLPPAQQRHRPGRLARRAGTPANAAGLCAELERRDRRCADQPRDRMRFSRGAAASSPGGLHVGDRGARLFARFVGGAWSRSSRRERAARCADGCARCARCGGVPVLCGRSRVTRARAPRHVEIADLAPLRLRRSGRRPRTGRGSQDHRGDAAYVTVTRVVAVFGTGQPLRTRETRFVVPSDRRTARRPV